MLSKLKIENIKFLKGLSCVVRVNSSRGRTEGFSQRYIFSKKDNAGFTLLELLMVITIATIITTVLVVQNSKWNDQLGVSTQTYDLSLMVRQAQFYSLGVREYKPAPGDKFDVGYGVSVSVLTPNQITFFADADGDLVYDSGEEIETKTLTRGVVVDRVCGQVVGHNVFAGMGCSYGEPSSIPPWNPARVKRVDISFMRPDTAVRVEYLNSSLNTINGIYGFPVAVYLRSPQGRESYMTISENGEISVQ